MMTFPRSVLSLMAVVVSLLPFARSYADLEAIHAGFANPSPFRLSLTLHCR
jgi:hypothetical protein